MKAKQAPKKKTRTARQTEASRKNGSKSKGPITLVGKAKASRNSVSHGLFCRAIPGGRIPIFADREEFIHMVQKITADFGVTTMMGHTLVEALAMDMLRLRHVRTMELAILDPGIEKDKYIDAAVESRRMASGHRSDEENEILLEAYTEIVQLLASGAKMCVQDKAVELMTADLWKFMNYGRIMLKKQQNELKALDARMAADPENTAIKEKHEQKLKDIASCEEYMEQIDIAVFLIKEEKDITAFITGRRRLAPKQRQLWIKLIQNKKLGIETIIAKVRRADARISGHRRQYFLDSVEQLDKLNQLGEYEDRIRRAITKNIGLIKEVEKMAVIEVL